MRTMIAIAIATSALLGCQKTEPGAATAAAKTTSGPTTAPTRTAKVINPGEAAAPGSQPANQPSGAPGGQPPGALPPGHPPTPEGETTPMAPGNVRGTIALADAVRGDLKAGAVLFIIVRRDEGDAKRGMLIAAKKVPVTGPDQFPMAYEVTPSDVMMQGTSLAGPVRVEARVDFDGDAISKNPGDLIGDGGATTAGGAPVDFAINSRL